MASKIYTKTGDKGQTSLIGGKRVVKHHIRIDAYGTVDELNAYIGLIRDQKINKKSITTLIKIQDRLFTIGALLAADKKNLKMKLPQLTEKDILHLEQEIDAMNELLSPMNAFVLPGGNTIVSYCHIARCVCRRAERIVVLLAENYEIDQLIIKYLNRLSDYIFVLSRKLSVDLKANEIVWKPIL